jgi:hypothetical protein
MQVLQEPYADAPGGKRAVLYFDKTRMEITNPEADPSSPWYVTNGSAHKLGCGLSCQGPLARPDRVG